MQRSHRRTGAAAGAPERGRSRAEQRLALQYAVARILADRTESPAPLRGILRVICESLGWDLGLYWWLNTEYADAGVPEHHGEPKELPPLAEPGKLEAEGGLAGWVCATREPSWMEDVAVTSEFPWGVFGARKAYTAVWYFRS